MSPSFKNSPTMKGNSSRQFESPGLSSSMSPGISPQPGNRLKLVPRSTESDSSVNIDKYAYVKSPDVRALQVSKKKSNLKKISKYESISKNVDLPNDDAYFHSETMKTVKET